MKKMVVVGSINMDIVSSMYEFPKSGQTIQGKAFGTYPGGKGANQAVAAGKLGADVVFLGKVGDDSYGKLALEALKSANVNTEHIETVQNTNTGVAVIHVNELGDNYIVIQDGANGLVDIPYVKRKSAVLEQCDIVLLQLEIPLETVEWVAAYCKQKGITVVLDPVPARPLDKRFLSSIDYITPNEGEIKVITQEQNVDLGAQKLLADGVKYVVNKIGDKGCRLIDGDHKLYVEGFRVEAVDTTAAGDSFNAGLAVALLKGLNDQEVLEYANAVGAIAVTGMGAQSAMPTEQQVNELIKSRR